MTRPRRSPNWRLHLAAGAIALLGLHSALAQPAAPRNPAGINTRAARLPIGRPMSQHPDNQPNIVLILADDLGWADLACYGNRFNETPNIDRLATQGVRFTDFYASGAVCSPTRCGIMTGQNQARWGITAHIPGHWRPFEQLAEPPCALGLPLEAKTIPEHLKELGYTSAHFGKWHLGWRGERGPLEHGFDVAQEISKHTVAPRQQIPPGEEPVRLCDYLASRAIDFIRENQEKRFFVEVNHYAVHIPLQSVASLVEKYEAKPKVEGYPSNPYYAALLEELDLSVGKMMKALEEMGLAENTLFVFTSDNGGLRKRFGDIGEVATSNAPLRDEKGSLYEGGIRVPLIVRWPGKAPAGVTSAEPAYSLDLLPTFYDAGGGNLHSARFDGSSLLRFIQHPLQVSEDRRLYWHYPHYHHSRPAGAMRRGDWKLIEFFDTGELELYNLRTDIGEQHNLAERMPDAVKKLRRELARWRQSANAQMPRRNPAHDPQRAHEWWNRRKSEKIEFPEEYSLHTKVDLEPQSQASERTK